ncbi:universal stress protein [Promicromonospora sp. MS192]|uniref:universal stress protein n=1 Tax=Promicromonospora sp. MS192 TaxID=3412684 RepID=UPI003C2B6F42
MTQTTTGPVLVGVDGSESATRAARWAALEAARRDVPLVLAHVWTPVPVSVPHAVALGAYQDALIAQGRQWLDEAEAAARDAAPGVVTRTDLVGGSVAARLIGRSASAGMVVLGDRGLGGFSGLVIGSIAVAVSTHAHCPVVVVRTAEPPGTTPPDGPQTGPVVVGVDGSGTSRAAVTFAFEAASARGVPLVAVHAWSDLPVTTVWELTTAWDAIERHESEQLSTWLAQDRARHPGVRVEEVVVREGPTRVLLEHAERAQLVVVGTRGRGGFRGLLLGSTSQALIHHAACPVAVVPLPRS